ncbi:Uncharacterised protein [Mycobacteroides abscessus subsp. abscessus]|nr:Uncharacterised protein [Mycobacteroides abscessus subsp. abscessus]
MNRCSAPYTSNGQEVLHLDAMLSNNFQSTSVLTSHAHTASTEVS